MNPPNTCERDTCECDKYFSTTVAMYEKEWKLKYHITRGGFDRQKSCRPQRTVAPTVATVIEMENNIEFGAGGGGGGGFGAGFWNSFGGNLGAPGDYGAGDFQDNNIFFDGFESNFPQIIAPPTIQECCGIDDFPNVMLKKPTDQCCGKHPYNPTIQQCCESNKVKYGGEVCD